MPKDDSDFEYAPVRFAAVLENQWFGVLFPHGYNWVDFTFFQFEVEHEVILQNFNLTLAFMGFKLLLVYTYGDLEELRKRVMGMGMGLEALGFGRKSDSP